MNKNIIYSSVINYLKQQNKNLLTNESNEGPTEYTYRTPLTNLLHKLIPGLNFFMEPKHINNNAPDYAIRKNDLNIGFIETKLPGADLSNKKYQEQFNRYKNAFNYIIFTDYLKFRIYHKHTLLTIINLGDLVPKNGHNEIYINAMPSSEDKQHLIHETVSLIQYIKSMKPQKIINGNQLSKIMSNQTLILADTTLHALKYDERSHELSNLVRLFNEFKKYLINNINEATFADYYAQTITYGLFSAKLNIPNSQSFNLISAKSSIPNTDPLLKKLFDNITDNNSNKQIQWVINILLSTFKYTNLSKILAHFASKKDPILYFYENFLSQYNQKERKELGVWYTYKEVCGFIVKSIDYSLEHDLNITDGLTCPDSIQIKEKDPSSNGKEITKFIPKVQILDPAVGTGTFLTECIKQMRTHFNSLAEWVSFANKQLLDQLNAFEILIVPYTIAHLKLYYTLKKYTHNSMNFDNKRFNIYLTNSLSGTYGTIDMFANELATERELADSIKVYHPIMAIMGNPPYNGRLSQNKNKWIDNLMNDYKIHLGERSVKGVDDDYVKFIRIAEHYINRNGKGVVGYITNNSYLDGPACRVMRNHLATTFDDIYIINLNGNSYNKLRDKNGHIDQNIFNIEHVGVSIVLFIKNNKNTNKYAKIHYTSILGSRKKKLNLLANKSMINFKNKFITWDYKENNDFKPQTYIKNDHYSSFISIKEIFKIYDNGITTGNDKFTISNTKSNELEIINDLENLSINQIRKKYSSAKDRKKRGWKLYSAINDIKAHHTHSSRRITKIEVRPLDYKYTVITRPTKVRKDTTGFLLWPRWDSSSLMILNGKDNDIPLGLIVPRRVTSGGLYNHALITNSPISHRILGGKNGGGFLCPIQDSYSIPHKNEFSDKFLIKLSHILGDSYKHPNYNQRKNILSWIISILWAPQFVHKYNTRLKISFPCIPLPHNKREFKAIIPIGNDLINAFILNKTKKYQSSKFVDGNKDTIKVSMAKNRKYNRNTQRLYINRHQYFTNVSLKQMNFFIGGYNTIKKWLSDRTNKTIQYTDINAFYSILGSINLISRCQHRLSTLDFIYNF